MLDRILTILLIPWMAIGGFANYFGIVYQWRVMLEMLGLV